LQARAARERERRARCRAAVCAVDDESLLLSGVEGQIELFFGLSFDNGEVGAGIANKLCFVEHRRYKRLLGSVARVAVLHGGLCQALVCGFGVEVRCGGVCCRAHHTERNLTFGTCYGSWGLDSRKRVGMRD
jgi:hypothetical protein